MNEQEANDRADALLRSIIAGGLIEYCEDDREVITTRATTKSIADALLAAYAAGVKAATPPPGHVNDGLAMIAAERHRQVTAEGWTAFHDDAHTMGELAAAAVSYASPFESIKAASALDPDKYVCDVWPWDADEFKPTSRVRDLVKAGALIAAEIDRLQRAEAADAARKECQP